MNYSQISKGLRLVFIAELIELFAVVVATILLGMESQATQAAAGAVVLITAIVGGILSLKGLIGAGKSQHYFASAWQMIVGLVLAEILMGVLSMIPGTPESFRGGLSNTTMTIIDTAAKMFILQGIMECYEKLGIEKGSGFVKTTITFFIIKLVVSIVIDLYATTLEENPAILAVIAIIYLLISIITYIFWLCVLGKASKRIGAGE